MRCVMTRWGQKGEGVRSGNNFNEEGERQEKTSVMERDKGWNDKG